MSYAFLYRIFNITSPIKNILKNMFKIVSVLDKINNPRYRIKFTTDWDV